MIQEDLFTCLMQEAIAYRQHIKLRWGDFTVTVRPKEDNLQWFIRHKTQLVTFVSEPTDDEEDQVYTKFLDLEVL